VSRRQTSARRLNLGAASLFAALLALLAMGPLAQARTVNTGNAYNGVFPNDSFDGSDAIGTPYPQFWGYFERPDSFNGQATITNMAVDRVSNALYVAANQSVYKFDASGVSQPFSALAPHTVLDGKFQMGHINPIPLGLAVDNSGGPTQGRIYVAQGFTASELPVQGYLPSGAPAGAPFAPGACGVGVAPDGNVWVVRKGVLEEYEPDGTFTGTIVKPGGTFGCGFAIDSKGDFYVRSGLGVGGGPVYKATHNGVVLDQFAPESASAVSVDISNDDVYIDRSGRIDHYTSSGTFINSFGEAEGPPSDYPGIGYPGGVHPQQGSFTLTVDPDNHKVYAGSSHPQGEFLGPRTLVDSFVPTGPNVVYPDATTNDATNVTRAGADVSGVVNADNVATTNCHFEWGLTPETEEGSVPCVEGNVFSDGSDHAVTASLSGLSAGTNYHLRLVVTNTNGKTMRGNNAPFTTPPAVTDVHTEPSTDETLTTAKLHGSFDSESLPTNFYFEYGIEEPAGIGTYVINYNKKTAAPPGPPASSDSVNADISGLDGGTVYHFRLVATNSYGTTKGEDQSFLAADPPVVSDTLSAIDVNTDNATIRFKVNPNGADTTHHVEYGPADCGVSICQSAADELLPAAVVFRDREFTLEGLTPDTTYHYRVYAENLRGSDVNTVDHFFHTFPTPTFSEACPNNLARQQTSSAFLLDCRAYELVSAPDTNGYDVESTLVPGQKPFAGFPHADGKVLYGVHDGGIPGTGSPTNKGVDSYIATRDAANKRWQTEYVGIPSTAPSAAPFASSLLAADSGLGNFAFGGAEICDPCFSDGSTGIPIHTADGSLVQGMVGSIPVPLPEPAGGVTKHFSGDGSHFLFSSTQQFEPDGNSSGTDVTIYDRNLDTNVTQVVSTDETGATIANGSDVRALDVSEDGSRVLIGNLVSTDAEGNEYYDLYLHEGTSPDSIPIETGGSGALYAGMTADASQIFFTTRDNLADDTDSSADLFRATIAAGAATVERISKNVSGTDNFDGCDPAGNSFNFEDWNAVPGELTDCSVAAVGGGGGVASNDGSIYFLSPEQLDGNGVDGAPNLFVARPGSDPQFVTTLESGANSPVPPPTHNVVRTSEPFTNPEGVAIDHADGSYYVLDNSNTIFAPGAFVQKFDASGNADFTINGSTSPTGPFAEFGNGGAFGFPIGAPTSIAVDNYPGTIGSPNPSYRDLYVPDLANEVIDKFDPLGNYVSQLSVPGGPSSVTVDPSNGHVYATKLFGGAVVFAPNGAPVAPFSFSTPGFKVTDIAVDAGGFIYVTDTTQTLKYNSAGTSLPPFYASPSYGVEVDPADNHIYIDVGNQVKEFTTAGEPVTTTGVGTLSNSASLAADTGTLIVSNKGGGNVVVFGPASTPPDPSYDSPLVIDSVKEAGVRHTEDFQITPDGDNAVFTSTLPLTGFDSDGHQEVFRFNEPGPSLDCASCTLTNSEDQDGAFLPSQGLGLTDDGRVFFTTAEQLVLADANKKRDAYEWNDGEQELISTGAGLFESGMLSVSADGTDALFFTRDTLSAQDRNGPVMKIYDARENGGFFIVPASPPCAASDECHGAGSKAAPPADLSSIAATPGQYQKPARKRCRKGFVRRRGRCVARGHKKRAAAHTKRRTTKRHG
jgi:hypothetical protein